MSTSDAHRGRPALPVLAAAAVLAVILGVVAWQRGGDSSAPTAVATSAPGTPSGSAASEAPSRSDGGGVPAGRIAATGYHVLDATHLAIVYANGVAECYGTAGEPLVEESRDAVTVTIPRVPADLGRSGNSPGKEERRLCMDIALVDSVEVTLDAPLAGRTVRDGSRDGAALEPQSLPGDPT